MNKTPVSLCLLALLLGGCASERIVLLPSGDGTPGAVVVRDQHGEVRLEQPYAGIRRSLDANRTYQSSPEEVAERFGATLAARPARPSQYVLYFEAGGNVLTQESQAALIAIRKEVSERAAAEVMVVGHTDRVGTADANDRLSLKRAQGIRELLVESGVAVEKLEVVGRGERDPLVLTADEVDEPRNRRVEINVR